MCTKSARILEGNILEGSSSNFTITILAFKIHIVEDEGKFPSNVKLERFLVSDVNIQNLFRHILLTACYLLITCLILLI